MRNVVDLFDRHIMGIDDQCEITATGSLKFPMQRPDLIPRYRTLKTRSRDQELLSLIGDNAYAADAKCADFDR